MLDTLAIRWLEASDIIPIAQAFRAIGWNKPEAQYERYLSEQIQERRVVFVATLSEHFTGYLTINWQPDYPPFRALGIPEIQDFNVLPTFRRRGIGTALMDAAEKAVALRSAVVGIGVGLTADYGAAQRLYVRRGYIPDGKGIIYGPHFVQHGEQVIVDDALNLYFTKQLAEVGTR